MDQCTWSVLMGSPSNVFVIVRLVELVWINSLMIGNFFGNFLMNNVGLIRFVGNVASFVFRQVIFRG